MLDAHQGRHLFSNKPLIDSSLRRKQEFMSSEARVTEKSHFGANDFSGGLSRTKSVFSIGSRNPSQSSELFHSDMRCHMGNIPESPSFDKNLRAVMEPHLRKARLGRMEARKEEHRDKIIATSAGVPYVSLRAERPFLFNTDCYPLHEILAQTLGVEDLSNLHEHSIQDKRELLSPLLDSTSRRCFHESYDKFVTMFCIPLLHSFAMKEGLLQNTSPTASTKIVYRYQAFPCIRVVRPGEASVDPHCDVADGHSIGNLNFHIPLTPSYGTNSLYTESHVGREDWHPLTAKSVGLGYLFDGARCVHFGMENTTPVTRVSIDFRVAIYRQDFSHGLCSRDMLQDDFSSKLGYYDEAVVETGRGRVSYMQQFVAKKKDPSHLLEPDSRVGFPFA